MPRVDVPVVTITRAGALLGSLGSEVTGDAANNHTMKNSGVEVLGLRNNGATTRTVTIPTPKTVDGLAIADRTVQLLANEHKIVGPFPEGTYDQASGTEQGQMHIDVDHADVRLQAWRIP